jgi:tRNA-modifying protein YgfZ
VDGIQTEMRSEGVRALMAERAFVDLAAWRKVRVSGGDAVTWLHDLLTADIAGLAPGGAVRSLLLTPTGKIRADIQVLRRDDDVVLLQDPEQPDHIGLLLHPYLLSSAVALEDRTSDLAAIAIPGAAAARVGLPGTAPSVLGAGIDLLVPTGRPAWRLEDALIKAELVEADAGAVESWRVWIGRPRMGHDFDGSSLPADAGLESTIDVAKGCFLGQESVARVRNLGHPRTALRHVSLDGPARAGEVVLAGATAVGEVTSAVADADVARCIVRVRWDARDAPLMLPGRRPLTDLPHAN